VTRGSASHINGTTRIGHASPAAALRNQHVMRDKAIAAGLDRLLQAADALTDGTAEDSGTQMACHKRRKTA